MFINKTSCRRYGPTVLLIVRYSLGCLFLYSALPKIRQPYDFLSSVYQYEMLGPKAGMVVAMVLPWFELVVGICLLGGIFVSGALLAVAAMGAMFTCGIAMALYRGLNITCGCFGASSGDKINFLTLIRAAVILLVALAAYLAGIYRGSPVGTEAAMPDEDRMEAEKPVPDF